MPRIAIALVLVLGACGSPPPPPAAPRVVLSAEARIVYERSLARDATSCAVLTAGLRDPSAALLEVTERVTAPPTSGMRAAQCLIRDHADEIEPVMTRWVSERATMGFGLLVLDDLDHLDRPLAERLAWAALEGEYADAARRRIERSSVLNVVEPEPHALETP